MIYYSQCWEDHALMREALAVNTEDTVACVASGGENVLALLLDNPKKVIAADTEQDQLRLLRLKIAAIKHLDLHECAQLLGFEPSTRREALLARLQLPETDEEFWKQRLDSIADCGRFDTYLARFRRWVLAAVPGKRRVKEYLAQPPGRRADYYRKRWEGIIWKGLLRMFFTARRLAAARHKDLAAHDADELLRRIDHGLTQTPNSYYLRYVLTGEMRVPQPGHPYLDPENFSTVKQRLDRVELRHQPLREVIGEATKICASDIFDAQSQDSYEDFMRRAHDALTGGGRICYWNNFVDRCEHPYAFKPVQTKRNDRIFFYRRFIAEQRLPGAD